MGHAHLWLKAYKDPNRYAHLMDLAAREHLEIALQRLNEQGRVHQKRLAQYDIDQKLITGDIWLYPPAEDERRITLSTASTIANLGSAMLYPRAPTISCMPYSMEPGAQTEADTVQKWLYAAMDNINGFNVMQDWAKAIVMGVGALHMIPWQLAMEDEVPVQLDVPESSAVYYHMNSRGRADYVFIRHVMSEMDLEALIGAYTMQSRDGFAERETFCYYSEERFIDPASGNPDKRILYGIISAGGWLYPLTDITEMMPDIPVFLAFNNDGFNWRGKEEVRARGIYTQEQESLLVASDMFSQLVNGTMRVINPALARWTDPNGEPSDLDFAPGAVNNLHEGERIEPINQVKPDPAVYEMYPAIMESIARNTIPQVLMNTKDLDGVSGATFVETLQPITVRNQGRQANMAMATRMMLRTFLKHMASVVDPVSGIELYGVDPRDNRDIVAMAHPDMLLRNTRIQVRLSQQTPRSVWQYLQVIQGLGDRGYLPRSLVTEQTAELLQLPVTDMTSITQQIAADDAYKIQIEVLKAKAAEAYGIYQQNLYNKQENPALLTDGTAPVGMHSEMIDPMDQAAMKVPTMQPVNGGSYG
jgi:hypothetical protein